MNEYERGWRDALNAARAAAEGVADDRRAEAGEHDVGTEAWATWMDKASGADWVYVAIDALPQKGGPRAG